MEDVAEAVISSSQQQQTEQVYVRIWEEHTHLRELVIHLERIVLTAFYSSGTVLTTQISYNIHNKWNKGFI